MNKTSNLSDKSAVYLRNTIGFASLGTSFLIIASIILGIIPIFDISSNPITIVYNLAEFVKIASEPLLYCLLHIAFSIIYIVVLVLSIMKLIEQIKTVKLWKSDTHDTKTARYALTNCVMMQNEILIYFVILMVSSYVIDSYKLNFISNLVLVMLVVLTFAVNYMRKLLVKRHLLEGVLSPLITTVLLVIIMLFVFNTLNVDLDIFVRQSTNFIRAVFTMIGKISFNYFLKIFVAQILVPTFSFYVLVEFILLLIGSVSFGMRFVSLEQNCKRFMLVNLIAFGVIVALQVLAEGVYQPDVMLNCALNNLEFVIFGVSIFLISKNQGSDIPDAKAYEDFVRETVECQENTEKNENIE